MEPPVAESHGTTAPSSSQQKTDALFHAAPTSTRHVAAPPEYFHAPPLDPRILANVVQSYDGETLLVPHCDVPVYHGTGRLVFRTGFVYTGAFYLGRMHGHGCIEWTSGVVYDGAFVDNEMRGRGTYSWPNGSSYTGDVVAGKRHGRGVFVTGNVGVPTLGEAAADVGVDSDDLDISGATSSASHDPPVLFTFHEHDAEADASTATADSNAAIAARSNARYDGEWRDGLPHGDGVLTYDDASNVRYEGQFQRGRRDGHGQMQYASGNVYDGEWVDDVKCGYGVMKWMGPPLATTQQQQSQYQHNSLSAVADTSSVLHELYEGAWRDDYQHGIGRHVWLHTRQREKNYYEGAFERGLRHGCGVFYYANGARYDGAWRNNVKHGSGTFYYDDGRVFHGAFRHDRCVETAAAHAMESAGAPSSSSSGGTSNGTAGVRMLLFIDKLLLPVSTATPVDLSSAGGATGNAIDAKRDKAKRAVENAALRLNTELRALYRSYVREANDAPGSNDESALLLEVVVSRKLLADCGVHITSGGFEQLVCAIRHAQRESVCVAAKQQRPSDTDAATNGDNNDDDSDVAQPPLGDRVNALSHVSCAGIVPHDELLLFREFVELLVRLAHTQRTEQLGDEDDGSNSSEWSLADAFTALYEQMMRNRNDMQQNAAGAGATTSWLQALQQQLFTKETQLIAKKHSEVLHRLFKTAANAANMTAGAANDNEDDDTSNGDPTRTRAPATVTVRALLSLLRHVDIETTSAPKQQKQTSGVFDARFKLHDALVALEQVFAVAQIVSVIVKQQQTSFPWTASANKGSYNDDIRNDNSENDPVTQQKLAIEATAAVDPFFVATPLVFSEFVEALAVVLFTRQYTPQQTQPTSSLFPLHVLLDQFLHSIFDPAAHHHTIDYNDSNTCSSSDYGNSRDYCNGRDYDYSYGSGGNGVNSNDKDKDTHSCHTNNYDISNDERNDDDS